jgi:hypothetical protein
MHDKPKGAGDHERASPTAQDFYEQRGVLHHVLSLCPEPMTLDELIREMTGDSDEFIKRDGIERAVRELIGAGLLQRVGKLVLPTRAAAHFSAITEA